MLQYPRRTPCVMPVAIDGTAPAPGDTLMAIAAPKNVSPPLTVGCTSGPSPSVRRAIFGTQGKQL